MRDASTEECGKVGPDSVCASRITVIRAGWHGTVSMDVIRIKKGLGMMSFRGRNVARLPIESA